MGTHLRELSEGFPMNTNMTGFRWFSKIFASLALGESSLSRGRVNGGGNRSAWAKQRINRKSLKNLLARLDPNSIVQSLAVVRNKKYCICNALDLLAIVAAPMWD